MRPIKHCNFLNIRLALYFYLKPFNWTFIVKVEKCQMQILISKLAQKNKMKFMQIKQEPKERKILLGVSWKCEIP